MSLLQEVIEQYGVSETAKTITDKTDKRSKTPGGLTDKTDKRASVSSVSEWSELLENKNGELEDREIPVATEMVAIMEMREKGVTPDHYTSTPTCKHCGPVPIWDGCPPNVQGCPWCLNRHRGLPIPKPNEDSKREKK